MCNCRKQKLKLQFKRKIHSKHKQAVFSGIQPTGVPHLGNYFGAIKKWVQLQANPNYECIFSIVDLHSITLSQDPHKLKENIHIMAACLLACGINPDSSVFFLQSQVPQHAELAWIIGCLATMSRLSKLPQFKEKTGHSKDNVPLGLFIYPILQAADILLYKANQVPVGEDQVQHIQLCQHLARVFNNKFGEIFPVPMPLIDENSARIKSLRQPSKKMSKSDADIKSRIELTDVSDVVTKRVRESLTDFTSAVSFDPEQRPGVSNLILVHSLCTGKSTDTIVNECKDLDTGQYKLVVAAAVNEHLRPIRAEVSRLMNERNFLEHVLKEGSEKASEIAQRTMKKVKEAVGLTIVGR